MTAGPLHTFEELRALFLRIEFAIGRDVCADPVMDIVLMIASENARGRYPTANEVLLAVGAPRDTAKRFIDALLNRNTLVFHEGRNGLALGSEIRKRVEAALSASKTMASAT